MSISVAQRHAALMDLLDRARSEPFTVYAAEPDRALVDQSHNPTVIVSASLHRAMVDPEGGYPSYRMELGYPDRWTGRLSTGSIAAVNVPAWKAVTDRQEHVFDSTTWTTRQVRSVLDAEQRDRLDDSLDLYATWWERRAIEAADLARQARGLYRPAPWACPTPSTEHPGGFQTPDGVFAVVRLDRVDPAGSLARSAFGETLPFAPHGAWGALRLRSRDWARPIGPYPYWHSSRRAADAAVARELVKAPDG